ncbi:MAG: GNAT family N-acetyltransferase [Acidimicrobiales bacterium]
MHLDPMSASEIRAWLADVWASYFDDMVGAGFTPDYARANIEQNQSSLFADGIPNAQQRFFHLVDGEERVGGLWVARRGDDDSREWFIYNIEVAHSHRGRGLGRAAMLAAEDYVRSHGGTKLNLNVFGPNAIARRLYESLDYRTIAIGMSKDLLEPS